MENLRIRVCTIQEKYATIISTVPICLLLWMQNFCPIAVDNFQYAGNIEIHNVEIHLERIGENG